MYIHEWFVDICRGSTALWTGRPYGLEYEMNSHQDMLMIDDQVRPDHSYILDIQRTHSILILH